MEGVGELESVYRSHSCNDFRWIDPKDIVVAQWVRLKCMFGCDDYGKRASCPPNVPSIPESERFMKEYHRATIFHFQKAFDDPDERHKWAREVNLRLLAIEREVFMRGHQKAFLLFQDGCNLCRECASGRTECKDPKRARPTVEAMGVDVFTTVRGIGYPVNVLTDYHGTMNRYAILLVE